jgi:hypothetical protein
LQQLGKIPRHVKSQWAPPNKEAAVKRFGPRKSPLADGTNDLLHEEEKEKVK